MDPGERAVQQTVVAASVISAVYSGDCQDTGRSVIKRGKMQEMHLPLFLFIKLPLWVHTGTYEDDNTKHNNIQKIYNQQHGAAAETAPGQFLQMRNHRLVSGGSFYVSGIDHEARLEADGEDVPFDVPYLRMRSASGSDRQMDRRLA